MLDKFKQLQQLRQIRNALKEQKASCEKEGVKITLNGEFEIEELILNADLSVDKQQLLLKECFNESARKIRTSIAQQFSGVL